MSTERTQNITLRRRKQLFRSKSIDSLSNDSLTEITYDLNTKSLDLSTGISNTVLEEMQIEINNLKEQLQSTQNELEITILENNELKNTISRQQLHINTLKKVCTSPLQPQRLQLLSARKRSRRSITDNLRLSMDRGRSPCDSQINSIQSSRILSHSPQIDESPSKFCNDISSATTQPESHQPASFVTGTVSPTLTQGCNTSEQPQTKSDNVISDRAQIAVTEQQQRVMIFADQSGYGVRNMLQSYLGKGFLVTSMIKPNATIEEVLKCCASSCKDFNKSDFVLILAGSNDKNPINIQTYLYYTLCQMKFTNVLIGQIYNNNYLNVSNVNQLLKLVCNNCKNSCFVPLNNDFNTPWNRVNKLHACRLLHRQILHENYKIKYLTYTKNVASHKEIILSTNDVGVQTDIINAPSYTNTPTSALFR